MNAIFAFLRSRGWKRRLSWWYKPLPGWETVAPNQELFGTAKAFDMERRSCVDEEVRYARPIAEACAEREGQPA